MDLRLHRIEGEMLVIEENLPESILVQFPQYTRNVGFYRFTPYQVLVDLHACDSIARALKCASLSRAF